MSKITKLLSLLLLVGFLAACGNSDNNANDNNNNNGTSTNDNAQTNTNNGGAEGTGNNTVSSDDNQKVDVADEVAAKITELEEVETAHVLVTENNAYVAVKTKNGNEGGKDLEKKIGDKAREAGKDFNNVYVSLDPNFFERVKGYGEKIRAGEPIEGFYDEFKTTLKDVFPDAH